MTQLFSLGGSFLHSQKTYYLVQDQDTLAMQFPEADPEEKLAAFGWQFRPVLGRDAVTAGLRQTFAQVSFPVLENAGCVGTVEVLTRWRKYNAKTGAVGPVTDEFQTLVSPIHAFDLTPQGYQLRWEDLGSGQSAIEVYGTPGWVMPGVRIRFGATILDGASGLMAANASLRFTAPTDAISTTGIYLLGRDGSEVEILHPLAATSSGSLKSCSGGTDTSVPLRVRSDSTKSLRQRKAPEEVLPLPPPPPDKRAVPLPSLDITSATVTSFDPNQSLVTIALTNDPSDQFTSLFPLVAVIGGRTFGLRDAPFQSRPTNRIAMLVPTAFVRTSRWVTVKRLFWGPRYSASAPLTFGDEFTATAPVLLSKNTDGSNTFLRSGTDLKDAKIVAPVKKDVTALGTSSTAATFTLASGEVTTVQQIVVQRAGGQVAVLAMRKADPPGHRLKIMIRSRLGLHR